jgi:hypothetical protein
MLSPCGGLALSTEPDALPARRFAIASGRHATLACRSASSLAAQPRLLTAGLEATCTPRILSTMRDGS